MFSSTVIVRRAITTMKNLLKLIEAATGLILVLAIFLAVVGAFYR